MRGTFDPFKMAALLLSGAADAASTSSTPPGVRFPAGLQSTCLFLMQTRVHNAIVAKSR